MMDGLLHNADIERIDVGGTCSMCIIHRLTGNDEAE